MLSLLKGGKFERSLKKISKPSEDILSLLIGRISDVGKRPERRDIRKIPFPEPADITDKGFSLRSRFRRLDRIFGKPEGRCKIIGRSERNIPDIREGVPPSNARDQFV